MGINNKIRTTNRVALERGRIPAKQYYPKNNAEVVILDVYGKREELMKRAESLGMEYVAAAPFLTNKELRSSMSDDEIKDFLNIRLKDITHPMETYPELDAAMEIIKQSIESGDAIGVYGDYDGDGITSSLIVSEVLKDKMPKDNVHVTFADIGAEGFGFSERGLDELVEKGCKTIIVVDTGSNSVLTLEKARELGINVIVMDHHHFNEDTPLLEGVTYVNPHLHADLSNEEELKNAGMSWFFAKRFYNDFELNKDDKLYGPLLGYAAIGTITDAGGQFEGEFNRALIHEGLGYEAIGTIPGVENLFGTSGENIYDTSNPEVISAFQSLSLGKRISTVNPRDIYDAISPETSAAQRKRLSEKLLKLRDDFNNTSEKATEEAITKHNSDPKNVIVEITDPKTVPSEFLGTSGSIASRIAKRTGRPAFVFVKNTDGTYKGSYRLGQTNDNGLDILERMSEKYPDIMVTYGGHGVAGGLTIENEEKLAQFKDLIEQYVDYQVKHNSDYLPRGGGQGRRSALQPETATDKFWTVTEVESQKMDPERFERVFDWAPFSFFNIKRPSYYTKGLTYKGTKGKKWLFVNEDGKEIITLPGKGVEPRKEVRYDMVFRVDKKRDSVEFVPENLQNTNL